MLPAAHLLQLSIVYPQSAISTLGPLHSRNKRLEFSHKIFRSTALFGAALLPAANGAGSFITGHEVVIDGGNSSMTI